MSNFEEFEQKALQPAKSTGEILKHAFENYKGAVWISAVVIILVGVVSQLISLIFGMSTSVPSVAPGTTDVSEILGAYPSSYYYKLGGISILSTVIFSPLLVGIMYLCHKKNIGRPVLFSDVFIGYKQNTLNIVIYAVIISIIQAIALALCVLPVFFVAPLFLVGYPILLFENAGAIDALKKSFNIAKENYVVFLGAGVLGYILSLVGIVACFIGILFTFGYIYSVMYSTYVAFEGTPREIE